MADRPPLPVGWIEQVDSNSGHTFYVDTLAKPPRSIWVHPLEDEQYLREHPAAREKANAGPPRYSAPPTPPVASASNRAEYAPPTGKKRGLFGKIRDAATGTTPEEREIEKRHKAEQRRQLMELREQRHQAALLAQQQQQAEMLRQQQMYQSQQMYYGGPPQPMYQAAPQQ
ncbi:hypothetical protein C8F01DRAFT_418661 [Mycena amicta]|nr:hypothetical protein C8F01DRAFT_418661 [Mycena amicta]